MNLPSAVVSSNRTIFKTEVVRSIWQAYDKEVTAA